jgi:hypothetical protein
VNVLASYSFSLNIFEKFIEFGDGACHCFGANDTIIAIYKSAIDWEIWTARQAEVEELREEKKTERWIEHELSRVEEFFLIGKCTDYADAKDYDQAIEFLYARADLLHNCSDYRFSMFLYDEVSMRLAAFPAKHCIPFMKKYDVQWSSYLKLCSWKNTLANKCEKSELKAIIDAAIDRFPEKGMLLKEACLFWERLGDYDIACTYCELGIERQLIDDTKGGFHRRLVRLKRKATQS